MVWIKIHSGPTAFCLSANTTELGHRHRSCETYSLAQQINELTAQEFSFNYTHNVEEGEKSHSSLQQPICNMDSFIYILASST